MVVVPGDCRLTMGNGAIKAAFPIHNNVHTLLCIAKTGVDRYARH